MKTISLVIPCNNEESNVPRIYKAVCEVFQDLDNYNPAFIFVDDGSTDETLREMKILAKSDSRVTYLSFSRNFGKESALFAGLEHSTGDLVAVLDADLQDPPNLLPEMIRYVESGYSCCAAKRVDRKKEPPIRSFFAKKFYKIMKRITKLDIVDGARDFRVMTRQMTNAIISMREINRFSKGLFAWVGFDVKWLEYKNIERKEGASKWSFWKLFIYALDGIIAFTTIPLHLTVGVGVICSILSFCYLLFIVFKSLIVGVDVPGYPSLISVILFVFGMLSIFLGIIGDYLAKIYMEIKKRPIYIIKEHSNTIEAGESSSPQQKY